MASLPLEVAIHIVTYLIPTGRPMFPPSHPVTHDLLNLSRVSKVFNLAVIPFLSQYCLYVKDGKAAEALLNGPLLFYRNDGVETGPSQMVMHLKELVCGAGTGIGIEGAKDGLLQQYNTLDMLVSCVGHCLKHLIVDTYVCASAPYQNLSRRMQFALQNLSTVEELCVTCCNPFLDPLSISENPIWTSWHQLRRLALYTTHFTLSSIEKVTNCTNLTHLILACPKATRDASSQVPAIFLPALKLLVVVRWEHRHKADHGLSHDAHEYGFEGWYKNVRGFLDGLELGWRMVDDGEQRRAVLLTVERAIQAGFDETSDTAGDCNCSEWILEMASKGKLWEVHERHELLSLWDNSILKIDMTVQNGAVDRSYTYHYGGKSISLS